MTWNSLFEGRNDAVQLHAQYPQRLLHVLIVIQFHSFKYVGPEIQSLPLMIGIEDKTRHFSITTLILLYSAATLYCYCCTSC